MDVRRIRWRPRGGMSAPSRVLGWAIGAPLAVVRYLLVTRGAVDEEIVEGAEGDRRARGPGVPAGLRDPESAAGVAVHRVFSLRIAEPEVSAEQLASIIAADPDLVSPWEVLRWELPAGEHRRMRPGDHVLVRMAGPWNGPLTVVARESHRLRFSTRPGHALKGELELRLLEDGRGLLAEVELWERADNRPLAFLHDRIGLTVRMQTHTWSEFLQRTRSVSGGRADGPVKIRTERGLR